MRAVPAKLGAVVADSLPYSEGGTPAIAQALRADGIDCIVGYLGAITASRIGYLHDAGIAFMPVTFAKAYSGPSAVSQMNALGLPQGATVFLDVESEMIMAETPGTPNAAVLALIAKINAWADAVESAGFHPAGYFGVPQPLTSDELWLLRVKLYWRGMGSLRDRFNHLAEPTKSGVVMTQSYPTVVRGGIDVDVQTLGKDYLGRSAMWCVGD
jgi:hypothetical protein